MKIYSLFTVFVIFVFFGCNVINPSEEIPGYIYIEEIDFIASDSSDHNISEIWVFDNTEIIGIYELPVKIPILNKGTHQFTFSAGIKGNGLSSNRSIYPYYTKYTQTIEIKDFEIDTVVPFYTYKEDVIFPQKLQEDFENSSIVFAPFGTSDTLISQTTNLDEIYDFGGSEGSGKVVFGANHTIFEVETGQRNSLPAGNQVWAELNYKSNNSFSIGVIPYVGNNVDGHEQALIIRNTLDDNGIAQWKKIYVELSNAVGSNPNASDFSFFIQAVRDFDSVDPELYFDNIKVVHF